jgi:CHAT domain-containing protein/tetratricopeptide (TPR) repeat protein
VNFGEGFVLAERLSMSEFSADSVAGFARFTLCERDHANQQGGFRMKSFMKLLCGITFSLVVLSTCGHAQTWQELMSRVDSLRKVEMYDSALTIAEQALAITQRMYGKEDTATARVHHIMGVLNVQGGHYRAAEQHLEAAIAIRKKALGPDHPDLATSMSNLAVAYAEDNRTGEAEMLYKQALAIREKVLGPDHPDVGITLNNLGILYRELGRYAEAESLTKRGLAIREKAYGPESASVAGSLICLADIAAIQNRYVETESSYRRALAILEKTSGPNSVSVGLNLNNLGRVLQKQGRYNEAETDYQRAIAILENKLGENHPQVASCLNNLSNLYGDLGRFSEEEDLLTRSLEIKKRTFGAENPKVAIGLMNLGFVHHWTNQLSEAEALYKQALEIEEKAVGTEHAMYATALGGLASVYIDEKKFDLADSSIRRTLTIDEKLFGAENLEIANDLQVLGRLMLCRNRAAEAEAAFLRSMAIHKKSFGKTHPDDPADLSFLALALKQQGNLPKAKEYEARAYSARRMNFSRGFAVMAEKDALDYSVFFRNEAAHYLSLLLDMPNGQKTNRNEIAKVVLSTKGQVSDGIFARHKATMTIAALVDSVAQASQAISEMYVKGPDPARKWTFDTDMNRAARHKDMLEADLARLTGEMQNEKLMADVDAPKVAAKLPAKSALVEFMRYEHNLAVDSTEIRYLAVVIKTGAKVSVLPLGSAATIDSAVAKYRRYFQNPMPFELNRENCQAASEDLYRAVWQPVMPSLIGMEEVFIAPDGMLNLVSFAGLLNPGGGYLIEHYAFQYLLSGRDLLQPSATGSEGTGLLAMGDPDYDATPASRATGESNPVVAGIKGVLASMTMRNVMSGCRALREARVERLRGTRVEVEQLAKRWRAVRSEQAATYFDARASEDRFKSDCHGKRVIHLATHGYYIDEQCRPNLKAGAGYVGESSLLSSGLFFAGANLMGKGAQEAGVNDGIVTAEEVVNLDLRGTDLVILSACETGVGTVRSGEGIFGLRRAFQMAGSRTVISALWAVDDESTSEMMGQLFSSKSGSIASDMRNAALKRIAALRNAGRSDDPFYWAAFVATGGLTMR